jgi:hypothetical protein
MMLAEKRGILSQQPSYNPSGGLQGISDELAN